MDQHPKDPARNAGLSIQGRLPDYPPILTGSWTALL